MRPTRDVLAVLFSNGQASRAARHRWGQCAHASDCGYACPNLDKEAGRNPSCIDVTTGQTYAVDLYAALRRPEFRCPRQLF